LAFVWFFGRAGVTPASAFALSILFVVGLQLVGNLPGAVLYALKPSSARRATGLDAAASSERRPGPLDSTSR
jgi:hypothetical protein